MNRDLKSWEEVPDEDLYQDGEIDVKDIDGDIRYKIKIGYYRYINIKGIKTLQRRTDVGLLELERWYDNE